MLEPSPSIRFALKIICFLETVVWQRSLQGPVYGLVHDRGVLYAGAFGSVNAVNPATAGSSVRLLFRLMVSVVMVFLSFSFSGT